MTIKCIITGLVHGGIRAIEKTIRRRRRRLRGRDCIPHSRPYNRQATQGNDGTQITRHQ